MFMSLGLHHLWSSLLSWSMPSSLHYSSFTSEVLSSTVSSEQPDCMCIFLCHKSHEIKSLWKVLTQFFPSWDPSPLFSFCLTQDKGREWGLGMQGCYLPEKVFKSCLFLNVFSLVSTKCKMLVTWGNISFWLTQNFQQIFKHRNVASVLSAMILWVYIWTKISIYLHFFLWIESKCTKIT